MEGQNLGYSYHLPTGGILLKCRNTLSQFSDIFSEFNKYIAPAYHHDRCERSVQMRLYSMHKREFVMVFLAFYICLGLAVFIGLAVTRFKCIGSRYSAQVDCKACSDYQNVWIIKGSIRRHKNAQSPPITITTSYKGSELLHKHNKSSELISSGPFIIKSPAMSTYHQQLWVIAVFKLDNSEDEILDKKFRVSVGIEALNSQHKPVWILHQDKLHNRTKHLFCNGQQCDQVTVLHLGYLDYTHYIVRIQFFGFENQRYNTKDVTFYFKSYNPGYTQIEIWFRFMFLLTTFLISGWFAHSLRKFPMYDWSIEQKWMSCMLPLLLLYNDPIFPLTFLMNSWIPSMLDAVFQATFLCGLLLFWICIYHGLRQTERKMITFYLPKLVIVGPLWFTAVVLATWQKANELQDPTYSYKVDTQNFYNFKIVFFVFIGIYVVYLGCLIIRAYSELRSMPFFDMRLKFLTLLMLIVITISIVITVMRFGIGVLEDNFVSDLTTKYGSSAEFMGFYGLLNFYLYTMAYVYSPSKKTVFDTSITKDNPAFSMINDSDEDVIYGSDEESRRPLNRSHNEDDSD